MPVCPCVRVSGCCLSPAPCASAGAGGMLRGDRPAGRGHPEHRAGRGNSPPHPPRGGQGSCQEEEEEEDGEGEGGGHPPAAGPAAPGFAQPGAGVAGRIPPEVSPVLVHPQVGAGAAPEHPRRARPGRAACPCGSPGHRAEGVSLAGAMAAPSRPDGARGAPGLQKVA